MIAFTQRLVLTARNVAAAAIAFPVPFIATTRVASAMHRRAPFGNSWGQPC
jgi:hypothetical protein